ncbi:hypothetical protein KSS87_000634 [Heliosperma pusillum]|nr:hypothetical protein KSS87_004860 [Heliosperma pusillum]KAH9625196.1 hypothetical protein KSS87_000634 [Heliosperma pusillum]
MQSETVLAKQKANKTQPRKAASSSPKEDSDDSEAKRYRLGRQSQRQFLETSSSRASTIKSHGNIASSLADIADYISKPKNLSPSRLPVKSA